MRDIELFQKEISTCTCKYHYTLQHFQPCRGIHNLFTHACDTKFTHTYARTHAHTHTTHSNKQQVLWSAKPQDESWASDELHNTEMTMSCQISLALKTSFTNAKKWDALFAAQVLCSLHCATSSTATAYKLDHLSHLDIPHTNPPHQ